MIVEIYRKEKEPIYFKHHNYIDEDYRNILIESMGGDNTILFRFYIGALYIVHIFTKYDLEQSLIYEGIVDNIRKELLLENKILLGDNEK